MTRSEHGPRWHSSGFHSGRAKIGLRHRVGDGAGAGVRRARDQVRLRRCGRTVCRMDVVMRLEF